MKLRVARKINYEMFRCALGIATKRYNHYLYKKAISTISKRTRSWKRRELKKVVWE